MTLADLMDEALAGLLGRPGRMILSVFGIAALVATLGLARTTGNRIIGRFDELAATEIYITTKTGTDGVTAESLPWDSPQRLERLNGVLAAGNITNVDTDGRLISTSPISDPRAQTEFELPVVALSPGRSRRCEPSYWRVGSQTRGAPIAVIESWQTSAPAPPS